MGLYKNTNGVLTPIAGRGKAEYGASTVRKKTITTSIPANSYVSINVTFDDPLDSADYLVEVTGSMIADLSYLIYDKTVNGFKVFWSNYWHGSADVTATYTAFKLYTDNEYNGLLNNQRYSTDEIDTGKVWIDGKKIYRKVFDCGALPNNTTKSVPHGISNLDWIVELKGSAKSSSGITYYLPLPSPNPANLGSSIQLYVAGANINIRTGSDLTTYNDAKVIIEYTKTT